VRAGEIVTVTLVGSNGAVKTTLLRAVSRVIPSRGTLRFDGADIASLTPENVFSRGLVQVPEGRQLFGKMTVEENLLMGAQRQKDQAEMRRAFERVYELFPILKDRRRQLAGNMSGGEQQMCAIGACANGGAASARGGRDEPRAGPGRCRRTHRNSFRISQAGSNGASRRAGRLRGL
jgi:ABC-type branched-subunit amino acid transport system ATPase component